jgi:hypothetical protein
VKIAPPRFHRGARCAIIWKTLKAAFAYCEHTMNTPNEQEPVDSRSRNPEQCEKTEEKVRVIASSCGVIFPVLKISFLSGRTPEKIYEVAFE